MVGIFEHQNGLQFVAISKDENTAKQALYNKYCTHKDWYSVDEWWVACHCDRCFTIKEIEIFQKKIKKFSKKY